MTADWWDENLAADRRAEEYAQRMARINAVLMDVRLHRTEQCVGHPLCPGAEAARKINELPLWEWPDVIISLFARLADMQVELENTRNRLAMRDGQVVNLTEEKRAAEQDAESGWAAYRREAEKRRLELPLAADEERL
jgi:hypothetical protein